MTKGVQGLKKSIIAVVTGFTVAAGILSGGITGRLGGGQQVQAAEVACTTYTGDNIEDQNYEYSQWAKPIRSYLTYENGTYMRVQAGADANGYVVEYFDSSFTITGRKIVPQELPLFGGFYEMNGNYYILSGQTNKNESDSVEVYRITKYTKDWNRVASCGLYGANTTVPFDAGSARMAAYGDYLMIRTSHEMYKSKKDGYNHQANVTIQVDTSAMKITDSYTKVMNVSFGYVSHSFNQFIQMENGKIVAVDHGDAHPRSIVLVRYPSVVTSNGFTDFFSTCKATDIMAFEGKSGDNYTGATVGGFEISDTAYLTAGSVDIDSTAKYSAGQDIFVGVVSKSTDAVKVNKITNYTAGQGTTDTPQFVKIGTNSYMLLWHRGSSVYYTKIDGNGNQVGAIYSLAGDLSDCVPVLAGDKLVWYTWKNETLQFYQININDLSDYMIKNVVSGHNYQVSATNASDASVVLTCSKCGQSHTEYVVKSFAVYWYGSADNGYYYTNYESRYDTGTKLKFLLRNQTYSSESDSTNQNSEMVWESSDTSIATVSNLTDESGTVNMLKPGIVKISIYPKYNPSCKETATFTITEAKKDDGSETKPGDGSETKPGDGSETKPGDGSETKPGDGSETKPGDGSETKPGDGSETKPGDGSEIKPGDSGKTEPGDVPAIITVNKTTISKVENKATGVKLTWKKVSDATGYVVYRKNSGSKSWKKIKIVKGASKTTYTDSTVKSKHGTVYSYRIESYKSVNGQTAKAVSKEKKILRLTAPTKLKIANQKGRKLSVTWKKQKKISGYQIQYSTGKTFAKGTKMTNIVKSSDKAVIKKLKKGKTYYVRIRSYQKSGSKKTYSAWSSYTKVKIKK